MFKLFTANNANGIELSLYLACLVIGLGSWGFDRRPYLLEDIVQLMGGVLNVCKKAFCISPPVSATVCSLPSDVRAWT